MASWKTIESRRETRLWITQIFIPGILVGGYIWNNCPGVREKAKDVSEKIVSVFKKKDK